MIMISRYASQVHVTEYLTRHRREWATSKLSLDDDLLIAAKDIRSWQIWQAVSCVLLILAIRLTFIKAREERMQQRLRGAQ